MMPPTKKVAKATAEIQPNPIQVLLFLQAETGKSGKQASLFRVYLKVYGRPMLLAGVLKIIAEMLLFVGPLAVGSVTVYVETVRFPSIGSQVRNQNLIICLWKTKNGHLEVKFSESNSGKDFFFDSM